MVAVRRRYVGWAIGLLFACSGGDLTLPNDAGMPATLTIVSGNNQQARAGTSLSDPLIVRVMGGDHRPIRDATVKFKFIGTLPDATLAPETVTTDDGGRAETRARLGSVIGVQLIMAWLPDDSADAQATFRAVAVKKHSGDREN